MIKKSLSPFAVDLEKKCIKKGLRLTEQRKVIVKLLEETVADTKFHPDVYQLHQILQYKEHMPFLFQNYFLYL